MKQTEKTSGTYPGSSRLSGVADEDKPREKALRHGMSSLKSHELLAIIFGTGTKGRNVIEMSRELMYIYDGHLSRIAEKSADDFIAYNQDHGVYGIGRAKALCLLAGIQLGLRAAEDAKLIKREPIITSVIAADIMRPEFNGLDHEEFWALYLTNRAESITKERICSGTLTATAVDVQKIIRKALMCQATRIIVFHNHPSGNNRPSINDDSITRKIKNAAELMDMSLTDHIIISSTGHYSYADEGRL